MRLAKNDLVRLLRSQGDHATATRVDESLPEAIDTDRDRELLAGIGLDTGRLQAHLAAGSIHPLG